MALSEMLGRAQADMQHAAELAQEDYQRELRQFDEQRRPSALRPTKVGISLSETSSKRGEPPAS